MRLIERIPSPKSRREQAHFIMVLRSWERALAKTTRVSTYRVALRLLYLEWQNQGRPILASNRRPVSASNMAMEEIGVSRRAKFDALMELEALGLITVERHRGRAPRVTLTNWA